MQVEEGDTPRIPGIKDRHPVIPDNLVVEEQVKHGQQVLKEYDEAFRALAK